jgi:acyl-CoA dehydrogenase
LKTTRDARRFVLRVFSSILGWRTADVALLVGEVPFSSRRTLIYKTAWQMDQMSKPHVTRKISDKVAMCNYRANRVVCDAADRAMQVHGAIGYSRHKPFEHIYRHHRRYRITEGAEEIQMRRVAQYLFGFFKRAS